MRLYIYDLIHGRKPVRVKEQTHSLSVTKRTMPYILVSVSSSAVAPFAPHCASAFLFRSIDAIKNTHIIALHCPIGYFAVSVISSVYVSFAQVCDVKIMHFIGERQQPASQPANWLILCKKNLSHWFAHSHYVFILVALTAAAQFKRLTCVSKPIKIKFK